ncbi:MAG: dienelactone hydrolase family protein [Rhodospirillaceae bacterium]
MFGHYANAALGAALLVGLGAAGAEAAIKTEKVVYNGGGKELTGYMAYDDAVQGKRPGVLVVHEWWGHDAYARRRAEMLAAEGYVAFALDMYGTGKHAMHPKDAGAFAGEVYKTQGAMQARFRAAYDLLGENAMVDAGKIAAIGYCFGGNVVIDMAAAGMNLKGVVGFHASMNSVETPRPGGVKAKVRVYNGADDPFIKPANRDAVAAKMAKASVDYEYVAYPGVVHGYTSMEATKNGEKFKLPLKYDFNADQDSWGRMLVFFGDVLK